MICCRCHKEISKTYGRVTDLGNYCKECAKQNEVEATKLYETNMKSVLEIEKKNAVKEFAEKLKNKLCDFFNDNEDNDGKISKGILIVDIIGVEAKDGTIISLGIIDELLKEYQK